MDPYAPAMDVFVGTRGSLAEMGAGGENGLGGDSGGGWGGEEGGIGAGGLCIGVRFERGWEGMERRTKERIEVGLWGERV